jgi:hypothetical protein
MLVSIGLALPSEATSKPAKTSLVSQRDIHMRSCTFFAGVISCTLTPNNRSRLQMSGSLRVDPHHRPANSLKSISMKPVSRPVSAGNISLYSFWVAVLSHGGGCLREGTKCIHQPGSVIKTTPTSPTRSWRSASSERLYDCMCAKHRPSGQTAAATIANDQ